MGHRDEPPRSTLRRPPRAARVCGLSRVPLLLVWSIASGCGGTTGREYWHSLSSATSDASPPSDVEADPAAPDAATPDAPPMAEALTIDAAVADAMPNADATVRDALESAEAGADAREEAAQADLDEGTFEVVILYADRELPDVQWRPARPDAGADDADGVDANASPPDAGNVISLDSGIEAASSPCAAFNTSVGRDGGPTGTPVGCSATEQRFVDKSIDCYTCLVNNSCLDDAKFGDTDNECEDLVGAAHSGDRASQPLADICLSEIDCVLATHCAATDTAGCYCGTLAGGACATSKTPANGACAQTEVDGLDEFITTPASVIAPLQGNRNLASGRADGIFACAVQSGCSDLCNK